MEDGDEEADGRPEEHWEAAKVVAVLVQGDDVLLVGWGWNRRDGKACSCQQQDV